MKTSNYFKGSKKRIPYIFNVVPHILGHSIHNTTQHENVSSLQNTSYQDKIPFKNKSQLSLALGGVVVLFILKFQNVTKFCILVITKSTCQHLDRET